MILLQPGVAKALVRKHEHAMGFVRLLGQRLPLAPSGDLPEGRASNGHPRAVCRLHADKAARLDVVRREAAMRQKLCPRLVVIAAVPDHLIRLHALQAEVPMVHSLLGLTPALVVCVCRSARVSGFGAVLELRALGVGHRQLDVMKILRICSFHCSREGDGVLPELLDQLELAVLILLHRKVARWKGPITDQGCIRIIPDRFARQHHYRFARRQEELLVAVKSILLRGVQFHTVFFAVGRGAELDVLGFQCALSVLFEGDFHPELQLNILVREGDKPPEGSLRVGVLVLLPHKIPNLLLEGLELKNPVLERRPLVVAIGRGVIAAARLSVGEHGVFRPFGLAILLLLHRITMQSTHAHAV
mmetsp:Transcript_19783/g.37231  ORF Transcript_19783/g.37231 Transcript_19783/m.37231 type:complete len:360 (-) Transcript_19783:142-1221(-)